MNINTAIKTLEKHINNLKVLDEYFEQQLRKIREELIKTEDDLIRAKAQKELEESK